MSDWNVVAEINGGLPTGDGSLLTPWNGRPNIVWGGGGVFAGDTLNCLNSNGNFIDGDSLGASGLLNTPIIIDMTDAVMASASAVNDWSCYSRNWITFQGGDMRGGGGSGNANPSIVLSDSNFISLYDQVFNNVDNEAVRIAVNAGSSVLRFDGLTLNGNAAGDGGEGLRFSFASGKLEDVLISNITANQRQLFRFYYFDYDTAVLTNGDRPTKFVVEDCTLIGPNTLPIATNGTEGTLENQCYIRRLTCINCGRLGLTKHNTIQTGNDIDLIICDNYIYNSYTDPAAGDGHAIIIDWYGGPVVPSNRVQVLRNRCELIVSIPNAHGINCWRGENSRIIANETLRCNGGIEVQNDDAGNIVASNTIIDSTNSGGRTLNQPLETSYWYNNIFKGSGTYGLIDNSGGVITESNNCYWENGTDTLGFTPTNPVYADPLFVDPDNDDYNLQQFSPCVGAGIKWWGNAPRPEMKNGEPSPDVDIDIGSTQSTWSANHPINL